MSPRAGGSGRPLWVTSAAVPAAVPDSVDVVVVGAGVAGLACAVHLVRAGRDVVVCEASDDVGGRVRTDLVDGLRLDRGFQVYNTAYPDLAALLDHEALALRPFLPGALVRVGDGLHRVADPRRRPADLLSTLRAPIGGLPDKMRVGLLAAADGWLPEQRLTEREDRSTADALVARGFSPGVVERFFRPFLSGVFLERELETSSRFFDLVWRSFARGTVAVPAAGMGALPRQLASLLPPGAVVPRCPVAGVRPREVDLADGATVRAGAVVVAADPVGGCDLVGLPPPATRVVRTDYHLAPRSPHDGVPALVLDGDGGPVTNSVVLTDAAPSYASGGRVLVSSSQVGADAVREPSVRRELARLHGVDTDGWEHVARYEVRGALPAFPAGTPLEAPQVVHDVVVCGDHRATPSLRGAAASGRRAARLALERLAA